MLDVHLWFEVLVLIGISLTVKMKNLNAFSAESQANQLTCFCLNEGFALFY